MGTASTANNFLATPWGIESPAINIHQSIIFCPDFLRNSGVRWDQPPRKADLEFGDLGLSRASGMWVSV